MIFSIIQLYYCLSKKYCLCIFLYYQIQKCLEMQLFDLSKVKNRMIKFLTKINLTLMQMKKMLIMMIIALLIHITIQANVSMTAFITQGYYYSHRCQVTFEIISDYFQRDYQIFHIITEQNSNFFVTIDYLNIMYTKGTDGKESPMYPIADYCIFKGSVNYYCAYMPLHNSLYFKQTLNSTFQKITFRLQRVICPEEKNKEKMSFRVQMPIPADYASFYFSSQQLLVQNMISQNRSKLSFVYDKQVFVNSSLLKYKQVNKINFTGSVNFMVGCKFNYVIGFTLKNISYYNSWDQIQINLDNQKSLALSTEFTSSYIKNYSCSKTSTGYILTNLNQTDLNKSYEIAQSQYFQYPSFYFEIQFAAVFNATDNVGIQVLVLAYNNQIQESWLNITQNSPQIYGRSKRYIQGLGESQFNAIQANETKFPLSSCISSNNSSQNSTITPVIPYTFNTTDSNNFIFNLLMLLMTLFGLCMSFYCRQQIFWFEKLLYILTIIGLTIGKIVFLAFNVDNSYLGKPKILSPTNTDSFQLFIIRNTFILIIIFNMLFVFSYVLIFMFSSQITLRINKFYGQKLNIIDKDGKKIRKCTFSSILFGLSTIIMFLFSYKFYGLFIFKLHLNTFDQKIFLKNRLRNTVLYRIHLAHLGIDLLLLINLISWIYLLIQQCTKDIFMYVLYTVLLFYIIHVYLVVLTFKTIYLMAKQSQQLNLSQNNRIKVQSQLLSSELQIDLNDPNKQNVQNQQIEEQMGEQNVQPTEYQKDK